MAYRRRLTLLACGVLLNGCVTAELMDEIQANGPRCAPPATMSLVGPTTLTRASRTADGTLHVETLWSDGAVRYHVLRPIPVTAGGDLGAWPEATYAPGEEVVPALELAPRANEVPGPDDQAVPVPVEPVLADDHAGPSLRLEGCVLELQEGSGEYRPLATYGSMTRSTASGPSRPVESWTGRQVALACLFPFTLVADAVIGGAVIAFYTSPVWLPIVLAL